MASLKAAIFPEPHSVLHSVWPRKVASELAVEANGNRQNVRVPRCVWLGLQQFSEQFEAPSAKGFKAGQISRMASSFQLPVTLVLYGRIRTIGAGHFGGTCMIRAIMCAFVPEVA